MRGVRNGRSYVKDGHTAPGESYIYDLYAVVNQSGGATPPSFFSHSHSHTRSLASWVLPPRPNQPASDLAFASSLNCCVLTSSYSPCGMLVSAWSCLCNRIAPRAGGWALLHVRQDPIDRSHGRVVQLQRLIRLEDERGRREDTCGVHAVLSAAGVERWARRAADDDHRACSSYGGSLSAQCIIECDLT